MAQQSFLKVENSLRESLLEMKRSWNWIFVYGLALIVLGVVGVFVPYLMSLAVETLVGALFFVSGLLSLMNLFKASGFGYFIWSLLMAVVCLAAGLLLWIFPISGIIALTLVASFVLVAKGFLRIGIALDYRESEGWGWFLLSGIVSIVLGGMILFGVSGAALWMVGLIVALDILFGGVAVLLLALALKKATL